MIAQVVLEIIPMTPFMTSIICILIGKSLYLYLDAFRNYFSNVDWPYFFDITDADFLANHLTQFCKSSIDKHAPIIK